MRQIRTRIDDVFEFIQERKTTNLNEVSMQTGLNKDKVEEFVDLLKTSGLVKVKYNLLGPRIYIGEETEMDE